mmetsp:Transcript_90874/g.293432  ORF Transcript_90874/g.293432 Transcript_90874/m.293432 type:complete len:306 (+) Transcript_90874:97-1014(+)
MQRPKIQIPGDEASTSEGPAARHAKLSDQKPATRAVKPSHPGTLAPLADCRVLVGIVGIGDIKVLLLLVARRHLLPDTVGLRGVHFYDPDAGLVLGLDDDLSPGVHQRRVPPGLVILGVGAPRRRHHGHVALRIVRAAPGEHLPVRRAGRHVEGTWVDQELGPSLPQREGHLGEAHVVADADAGAAPREVDKGQRLTRREHVRLLELHRGALVCGSNVDVEQVHLPVTRDDLTLGVKDAASVVDLVSVELRHGAANNPNVMLLGQVRQQLRRRSVRLRRQLSLLRQALAILAEELRRVGAAHHLA